MIELMNIFASANKLLVLQSGIFFENSEILIPRDVESSGDISNVEIFVVFISTLWQPCEGNS